MTVIAHQERVTAANVKTVIAGYDIVADGSDNFETRFLLNDACYAERKTLVFAAVTEFDGQLATFKAWDKRGTYPCYRCLFPAPPPPGTVPNCSETGVLGAAAGVMGALQALEVLKEITGAGESLAGKLLITDTLAARFRTVLLAPDRACTLCGGGRDSPRFNADCSQSPPWGRKFISRSSAGWEPAAPGACTRWRTSASARFPSRKNS